MDKGKHREEAGGLLFSIIEYPPSEATEKPRKDLSFLRSCFQLGVCLVFSVYGVVLLTSSQKVRTLFCYLNISSLLFHKSRMAVGTSAHLGEHFAWLHLRLLRENVTYLENKAAFF